MAKSGFLQTGPDSFQKSYQKANRRAEETRAAGTATRRAWYDEFSDTVYAELNNGIKIGIPRQLLGLKELDQASVPELKKLTVNPLQDALCWEELDVFMDTLGTVLSVLDAKEWAHKYIASLGGKAKSPAKAKAARENGKMGGRPRKQ